MPFRVFTLADYLNYLRQVSHCEGSTVDCIRTANPNAHISLFDGDQIVGPVPHHPHLQGALALHLLPQTAPFDLGRDILFVPADDQSLILGSNPGEHLHPIVEEIRLMRSNVLVIYGIHCLRIVVECKVLDQTAGLFDLSAGVLDELSDFHRRSSAFGSLNHDDVSVATNHPCHDGSLNSEKDIVACDDLSIDI